MLPGLHIVLTSALIVVVHPATLPVNHSCIVGTCCLKHTAVGRHCKKSVILIINPDYFHSAMMGSALTADAPWEGLFWLLISNEWDSTSYVCVPEINLKPETWNPLKAKIGSDRNFEFQISNFICYFFEYTPSHNQPTHPHPSRALLVPVDCNSYHNIL